MENPHENLSGPRYYWEYIKRFGKESAETWLKDFVIAVAPAILTVALAWGDRSLLEGALLAVEATGLFFAVVALRHFVHTSFLLFRERAHPELGGIRYTHWGYGVWGTSILIALAVGGSYGVSHRWLRIPPPIVLNVLAPPIPTITTEQATKPQQSAISHEQSRLKPRASDGSEHSPGPSTASQTAAQAPPIKQPLPPATFLDRVVQENRALTADDRNRLSTELYECDQFIKQNQAVGYKVSEEFGKITNDRSHGTLAKKVDDHIKVLRELAPYALDQYHGLQQFKAKWQYFPDQTEYVFGDDPYNAGEGMLMSAVNGMADTLASWSKISNRDQQEILDIVDQRQSDFQKDLNQFLSWTNGTHQRINQMRQSLDPNGVVQPIPSSTVAPAPALLSSSAQ